MRINYTFPYIMITILEELGHRKSSSTELLLCCVVCVKLSSVGEFGETVRMMMPSTIL